MVEGKRLDLVGSDRDNQAQERFDKGCGYISSGGNDKGAVSGSVGVVDEPVVREVREVKEVVRHVTTNGLLRFMV
jgi:hypothetical protein